MLTPASSKMLTPATSQGDPMPKTKQKTTTVRAADAEPKATMVVTLYDGTRQPIEGKDFLIRIFDGFQKQLFDNFKPAPTTVFSLPFHDNLQDNCTVLASGKGYVDAGFYARETAFEGRRLRRPHAPIVFSFNHW